MSVCTDLFSRVVTCQKLSKGLSFLCVVPECDFILQTLPERSSVLHEATCAWKSFVWRTSSKGLRIFDSVQSIAPESFLLSVSLFVSKHEQSHSRSNGGCCSNVIGNTYTPFCWVSSDRLKKALALSCFALQVNCPLTGSCFAGTGRPTQENRSQGKHHAFHCSYRVSVCSDPNLR